MKLKLLMMRLTAQPKKEGPVGVMATYGKYSSDSKDNVN